MKANDAKRLKERLASSPFVLNDHVSPDAIEARLPPRPQTEVAA